MKKIIILSLILLTSALTISAKEIAKNSDTNMKLTEVAGVYSITGEGGVLVIGNEQTTREFFNSASKAFDKNLINRILSLDNDKYELQKDDKGYYLIKIGVGGVKLRSSDARLFAAVMNARDLKKAVNQAKDNVKQVIKNFRDSDEE